MARHPSHRHGALPLEWHLRSLGGNGDATRPSRIPPMEFLLLCVVSVLFVFTAGAYFAGRGGD